MPITFIAKKARLSFDKNLIDPQEPKAGKKVGKYTCNAICSGDTSFIKLEGGAKVPFTKDDFDSVIEAVLKEKFGGKKPAKFENWAVRPNTGSCSQQTGERFSGYEDDSQVYFSPSRYADQGRPAFVRKDGTQLNMTKEADVEEARRLFYAGCYVNIKLNLAAFELKEDGITKRGVTTYLEAIQFVADGERFGKGEATGDGFEAEEDSGDDGLS